MNERNNAGLHTLGIIVMIRYFQEFLKTMAASFKSIVKAAKYDVTIDDLMQDAWLIASDLGKKRGREVDFSDPVDQDLVIRRVNFKHVKRGDWKFRRAERIDRQPNEDETTPDWAERLAAPSNSDPLVELVLRESAQSLEEIIVNSYSQVVAYLMAFANMKNDRRHICDHLAITGETLNRRITHAAEIFKIQPSLFDGIEKIGREFMPFGAARRLVRKDLPGTGEQLGWAFAG